MAAVELATGFVTLAVSTQNISADINKMFKGADKQAGAAGRGMGQALKKNFESANSIDLDDMRREVEAGEAKITSVIERSSQAQAKSRRAVEIAEAELNEKRASGRASASQLMKAEDKLTLARQKSEAASVAAKADLEKYTQELRNSKSALAEAESAAENAAKGSVSAWAGVGQRIKAGLSGDFKSAFNGIEGGASRAADDVAGEFTAAGDEASDGFSEKLIGGLKGLGGLAAGAGIGVSLASGITGGMEREKLGDKLAAQLNLAGPEAEKAGSVAGSLYAGAWGESLDETHDAVSAVMSSIPGMMDAPSEAIEGVTSQALDLATAFDLDVNESVGAVGVMMREGLATDANAAFDLMVGGMQRVPAGFRDELLPALTEYSGYFGDLGISGETAMNMMIRGAENGTIGIDKMGDAVKEFQIRSTDMSKATSGVYDTLGLDMQDMTNMLLAGGDSAQDAMGQIVQGLMEIEDPAARAEASIALFGTPLEDLSVNEIPKFLGMLDPAGDKLDDFAGSSAKLGDTLNNNTATAFEALKRGISQGFVDIVGNLAMRATDLYESLKPVGDWLNEHKGTWGPFAIGIGLVAGAVIGWKVATALLTSGLWAQAAALAAAYAPITAIVIGIGLLVGGIIWAYNNVEWFRDMVDTAWAKIKEWTAALVTWWTETAFPAVVDALTWVGDKFTWLYENVVKPVWQWIKDAVAAVVDWFTGTVVPNFQAAMDKLGLFFDFLYRNFIAPFVFLFKLAINGVRAWFENTVVPAFQKAIGFLGDKFRWLNDHVIQPVWSWIQHKIAVFMRWFDMKRAELQVRLARLGDKFKALYNEYVKPAFDWIKDKLTSVWNWVSDHVFDPFKRGLGRLQDAFTDVKNGIGDAWDKLKAKVKEPISFVVNKVVNPFIEGYNKINNAWSGSDIGTIGGFRKGGYTGNVGRDEVAGVVHGREHVTRAESTADVERHAPGFLDRLNRHGAAALGEFNNPAHMAVGAGVYGGKGSFRNPLQHAIYRTGTMNVSGGAPGWGLSSAINMLDRATSIRVKRGPQGANGVNVTAAPLPAWWAGYYQGNSVMLNNNVMGGSSPLARRTVATHELGHALGLPHSDPGGGQSIMSYANMYRHNSVTGADVAALSAIYGGTGRAGSSPVSDGGIFDVFDTIMKFVTGPLKDLKKQIEGNVFVGMATGLAQKIVDGVIEKGKSLMGFGAAAPDGVWDAPVGTVHRLPQGTSTIYNGTGGNEFFQRVAPGSTSGGGMHFHGDVYATDPEQLFRTYEKRANRREALHVA